MNQGNSSETRNENTTGVSFAGMGFPMPMMVPTPPMAVPVPPVIMPPVMTPPGMMPPVMMPPGMMAAPPMVIPVMMPVNQGQSTGQGKTRQQGINSGPSANNNVVDDKSGSNTLTESISPVYIPGSSPNF